MDCHWLQNNISISLCTEIASNDEKPCFPVKVMLTHTITLPPAYWPAIRIVFSVSSPHFDSTIQLSLAESGHTAEPLSTCSGSSAHVARISTPPMGLTVKGSHCSTIRLEVYSVQSFQPTSIKQLCTTGLEAGSS